LIVGSRTVPDIALVTTAVTFGVAMLEGKYSDAYKINAINPSGKRVLLNVESTRRRSSIVKLKPEKSRTRSRPTGPGSPSADCVTRLSRRWLVRNGSH